MRWLTWARLAVCLGVLGSWSCGDDEPEKKPVSHRDGGGEDLECMDEDGDGFGKYCEKGADCNDSDPNVTDECKRCPPGTPKLNCACKPGTIPVKCDPPDMKVEGGTLVCSEGTRYCRDSFWSDCEIIGQYTLIPDK